MKKSNAIIVDLDGTFSFVGDRSPYNGKLTMEKDFPNYAVIRLVESMNSCGYQIIFLSGRNENARNETKQFIKKYSNLNERDYQLFLKPDNDYRKDFEHKGEIFTEFIEPDFNVIFALEDRPTMVDFYRKVIGIPCFQVNEYKNLKK